MTPLEFFAAQYGDDPLSGNLVITRFAPRIQSQWCRTIEQAAEVCERWAPEADVYHGIGLRGGQQESPGARGDSASVIALPGFGRDLDYGIKPTNDKAYPPTREDALALLDDLPRQPTMIVNSGACLHTYWLFRELLELTDADRHHRAFRLSRGFSRLIERKAKARGWSIDATFDLARVLRPVGTFNYQHGEPPRLVSLHSYEAGLLWLPEEFEEFADADPDSQPTNIEGGPFTIPSTPVAIEDLGDAFKACYHDPENSDFRDYWHRKIKAGDGSPSVYTFIIGSRMYEVGATAQQQVDAMVTWRMTHDGDIESHRWYEQELRRIAVKSDTRRKTWEKKQQINGGRHGAAVSGIVVGPAVLKPSSAHQTAGGTIVVPLAVEIGGTEIDLIQLRSTNAGRSGAAKAIVTHVGAGHEVEIASAIGKILISAKQELARRSAVGGQTVRQFVAQRVPDEFQFSHRTDGGAWSEVRGCEIKRADFITFTPDWLMSLCMPAIDAPRSPTGVIQDTALQRSIESALRVEWATQIEKLPALESDASNLNSGSAAAASFRFAIVKAWTKLVTMEVTTCVVKDAQTENRASRTSLAGRVQTALTSGIKKGMGWTPVQKSIDAWYRWHDNGPDQPPVLLAMRYTIAYQLGVDIPGAANQRAFRALGISCGAFSDGTLAGVRIDRATGGGRLAVLSLEMIAEILVQPDDDEKEAIL
jgi:hypothetical protein